MFILVFQFRYKRRVYTQSYLDEKQLSKLHTKVRTNTVHTAILISGDLELCAMFWRRGHTIDTYAALVLFGHWLEIMVAKWLQPTEPLSDFYKLRKKIVVFKSVGTDHKLC